MVRTTSLAAVAAVAVGALLAALPPIAAAQSYRCVGADGKKYYGQTIPRPCIGLVVEQLNAQGLVIRRIDPKGTAAEREARPPRRRNDARKRSRAAKSCVATAR